MLERNAVVAAHACRDIMPGVVSFDCELVRVPAGIIPVPSTFLAPLDRLSISMPYIQLDGQQFPLIAGENAVGGNEGSRIRLAGNGNDGVLATFDVGADGSTVVRRLDGTVKVNGVSLGAEPAPLLHGDKIDVAGRELFFGDDRRAGNTQFVQPVRVPESAPHAAGGKPTAATGGRVISLMDGREYVVPASGVVFGRDPSCDIVVGSTEVSRKHASLTPSPEGYLLRDMSTNGVLVNGEPASSPSLLGRGDVLTIGDEQFRFYADSAPPPRVPLATLEVISSGLSKGTVMEVHSPLAHVGRGAHNDIVIADESVSDSHAKLQRREDGWYVVEMGSTNGTYVGGRRIDGEAPLIGAPDVRFGGVKFIFRVPDGATGGNASQTRAIAAFKVDARKASAGMKTPVVSQPGQRAAPKGASAAPAKKSSRWAPLVVFLLVLILAAAGVFILIKGH
jgi:pSer/pThr/pTyr-binding forkhead associated (FHA) protein